MTVVEERVDHLEDVVKDFVTMVGIEFNKLYNSQMRTEAELRAFKDEMSVFKDEMSVFKDEMSVFKDEMSVFKDEMRAFKDEMQDFKDEMRAYKEENRQLNRDMNRHWGELANKMGTMVEDLVAPSLPRIIEETLGQEVINLSQRHKRKLPDGRVKEYDAIAVTAELVCVNSTKSTLHSSDVDRFVEELAGFREFFPEYRDYPLVGILASLAVEESVLNYAEKTGFLVLAVGDQIMEVKNRPGFEPRRW
jgi:hypothetical protein